MTKAELIATVASRQGMHQPKEIRQVASIVEDVLNTITAEVARGNKVQLIGFGTFELKTRAAREGKNPRTGEVIQLPESKLPYFKAGKTFKVVANGDKAGFRKRTQFGQSNYNFRKPNPRN